MYLPCNPLEQQTLIYRGINYEDPKGHVSLTLFSLPTPYPVCLCFVPSHRGYDAADKPIQASICPTGCAMCHKHSDETEPTPQDTLVNT